MSKNMFEILTEMHVDDCNNGTAFVGVCDSFVSGRKTKQGAQIVMGAPETALYDIISGNRMVVLVLIDRDEYLKRKKEPSNTPQQ